MNLRPSNIPPQLHHLISLAEKYGIADDRAREGLIGNCSKDERRSLKETVKGLDDEFDLWLADQRRQGPSTQTSTSLLVRFGWRPTSLSQPELRPLWVGSGPS